MYETFRVTSLTKFLVHVSVFFAFMSRRIFCLFSPLKDLFIGFQINFFFIINFFPRSRGEKKLQTIIRFQKKASKVRNFMKEGRYLPEFSIGSR